MQADARQGAIEKTALTRYDAINWRVFNMLTNSEISQEVFDQLLSESIGTADLDDDKLVDKAGNMATANTCWRTCIFCD